MVRCLIIKKLYMFKLSIKSLDLIIGALFLIGLSFTLSYIGIRSIFPNEDISKPFIIIGVVMSATVLGMLYYLIQMMNTKPKIRLIKDKKIITTESMNFVDWIENESGKQEPSKTYLALVVFALSIIALIIWIISKQL